MTSAPLLQGQNTGQFEERLKVIMKEITTVGNIIIFIDELHTLVGAGAAEGSIDASNMLQAGLFKSKGPLNKHTNIHSPVASAVRVIVYAF